MLFRSKTQFLSNMSHELRTPMHAILSFAKLGVEKVESGPPEKLRRYFGNIIDAGERLLALVNDLLDITKLESGKMVYSFAAQDLWPVLGETVRELAELIRRRDLQLQIETPECATEAEFDSLRMGQVMRNLLSNAIKFTPEGGRIIVSVAQRDEPVPGLQISVCDEGGGIPQHELEAIFDKFIQSSKNVSGSGGTGLGLPISREIIRQHGGHIWAQNRSEGGACFVFWIPLRQEEKPSSAVTSAA